MNGAAPVAAASVRVRFGATTVLHDVMLTVAPQEFVALLGANGSGKSTLVRSIVGLQPVVAGHIELFGTPLDRFRDWSRIGFVPQRSTAPSRMPATVREVVSSGRTAIVGWFRRASAADAAAVDLAIEQVGLSARARDSMRVLSGGQQQRVLIARALAAEPELMVLDEPTAGVDSESQQAFAETLSALKDRGCAVLLVTHHLGPLASLVDRAVVLSAGLVVHDGPIPPRGMALDDEHGHHDAHDDHHHVQSGERAGAMRLLRDI